MAEEVVILMKDCEGWKPHGKFLSYLYNSVTAHKVLRGELLVTFKNSSTQKEGPKEGRPLANYRLKRDPNVVLYCSPEEVTPLVDHREVQLLEGVRSSESRHALFVDGSRLEWAVGLNVDTEVYVNIPGPNLSVPLCVLGVIRYIGPVTRLPGCQFGVEIKDGTYHGCGTTDGTFGNDRYFVCADNNGLFVSLDRISMHPFQATTQQPAAPKKSATTSNRLYASAARSGGPSTSTRSKTGPKETPADPPKLEPCHFKMNERVMVYDKKGKKVFGRVRWYGDGAKKINFGFMAVGIETEENISLSDFEGYVHSADQHGVPKLRWLLMPETMVNSTAQKPAANKLEESLVDLDNSMSMAKQFGKTKEELIADERRILSEAKENKLAADAKKSHQSMSRQSSANQPLKSEHIYEPIPGDKTTGPQVTHQSNPPKSDIHKLAVEHNKLHDINRSQHGQEDAHRPFLQAPPPSNPSNPNVPHSAVRLSPGDDQYSDYVNIPSTTANVSQMYGNYDTVQTGGIQQPTDQHYRNQYQQGQDQGRLNQYQQGQNQGRSNQYQQGQNQGRLNQYQQGQNQGQSNQYQQGQNQGRLNQYQQGQNQGRSNQYQQNQSRSNRYQHGQDQGQSNQYQQGQDFTSPSSQPRQHQNPNSQHGREQPNARVGNSNPYNLGIGSPVQVMSTNPNEPPRYGVIRWIGPMSGVEGTIAGVEMDEYLDGCTDGVFKSTGEKFFSCAYGHGLYFPLGNLSPDRRFTAVSTHPPVAHDNPIQVSMEEQEDQTILDGTQQMFQYIGNGRGIQGHQNSCYLDSTMFGLFALSDVFDTMFLDPSDDSLTSDQYRSRVAGLLWKGIVNPLRKNGVVSYESVMKMRTALDELGKMEGITEKEKDPEEFLNMLFKHVLHTKPFISIRRPFGVEQEFFVQLFVEHDPNLRLPTVGDLLRRMFREQQISFEKVPSKLLLQVPRFGREFQTYKRLIPELKLSIGDLTDSNKKAEDCFICGKNSNRICQSCQFDKQQSTNYCQHCSELFHNNASYKERAEHKPSPIPTDENTLGDPDLLSVICIETSHYVCFTRDPRDDGEKRWIFFDSMADRQYDTYNIPRVTDCTRELNEWVYQGDRERLFNTKPRELPELVRRFTQDIYMCVYVQPDVAMYGD